MNTGLHFHYVSLDAELHMRIRTLRLRITNHIASVRKRAVRHHDVLLFFLLSIHFSAN